MCDKISARACEFSVRTVFVYHILRQSGTSKLQMIRRGRGRFVIIYFPGKASLSDEGKETLDVIRKMKR